ncbi:MAG: hypothetical protein MRQ09_06670 [Candidatus Midichloria sp.]|nr:hypothetical protein [Candidatus Midichloria sp.]
MQNEKGEKFQLVGEMARKDATRVGVTVTPDTESCSTQDPAALTQELVTAQSK